MSVVQRIGFIYGIAVLPTDGGRGSIVPLTATAYAGSGKLQVMAHSTVEWRKTAHLASLCVRRLRERLRLRDLWAPDLDLYVGKRRQRRSCHAMSCNVM